MLYVTPLNQVLVVHHHSPHKVQLTRTYKVLHSLVPYDLWSLSSVRARPPSQTFAPAVFSTQCSANSLHFFLVYDYCFIHTICYFLFKTLQKCFHNPLHIHFRAHTKVIHLPLHISELIIFPFTNLAVSSLKEGILCVQDWAPLYPQHPAPAGIWLVSICIF